MLQPDQPRCAMPVKPMAANPVPRKANSGRLGLSGHRFARKTPSSACAPGRIRLRHTQASPVAGASDAGVGSRSGAERLIISTHGAARDRATLEWPPSWTAELTPRLAGILPPPCGPVTPRQTQHLPVYIYIRRLGSLFAVVASSRRPAPPGSRVATGAPQRCGRRLLRSAPRICEEGCSRRRARSHAQPPSQGAAERARAGPPPDVPGLHLSFFLCGSVPHTSTQPRGRPRGRQRGQSALALPGKTLDIKTTHSRNTRQTSILDYEYV